MSGDTVKGHYAHCAVSATVDRFDDAYLEANYVPFFTLNGKRATVAAIRAACAKARAEHLEVLPPCDNVNAKGHCQGHDVELRPAKAGEE